PRETSSANCSQLKNSCERLHLLRSSHSADWRCRAAISSSAAACLTDFTSESCRNRDQTVTIAFLSRWRTSFCATGEVSADQCSSVLHAPTARNLYFLHEQARTRMRPRLVCRARFDPLPRCGLGSENETLWNS